MCWMEFGCLRLHYRPRGLVLNHRRLLGDSGASVVMADDIDVVLGVVGASRCVLKLTEINNGVVEREAGHKSQRGE